MNGSPSEEGRVSALAEQILSEVGPLKDHWEAAAQLEVMGVRDVDARTVFGCSDVFELARRVQAATETMAVPPPAAGPRQSPLVWRFVKAYVAGLLFSMPMATQTFGMMVFGYTLWAWVDFTSRESTAIALGTIGSFVVTGGYTQAISRRGLFYLNQQEYVLAKAVSYRILAVGVATVVAVGLLAALANLVFEMLPADMALQAELYYVLLSLLWLVLSILYMVEMSLLITLITLVALLAVHMATLFLKWRMVAAHSLGLTVAILLALVCGWAILHGKARQAERESGATELPRGSMLVYSTAPYFWYGVLYFTFVLTDRVIAWSASAKRGFLPYFMWFDSRYELGMDWALFSFVLMVGALEFTIRDFSNRIIPAERNTRADEIEDFNRKFTHFYYSHLVLFLVVAATSVAGGWVGLGVLRRTDLFPLVEVFFNPTTKTVFWWAAIGYVFLVFGLFNSVFLFSLSRPGFVLRSLGLGLVLNVGVGFILSRAVRYDWAVIGMTVGTFGFMLASSWYARRTFKRLDYYYYSAY